MQRTDTDVDAFLAAVEGDRGEQLRALDRIIAEELAGLERVLWEGRMWGGTEQRIVGYGGITQARPRGASIEWFLVGLAAQQRHLSVYVSVAEDGVSLAQSWADRLGTVKAGAAAITFASLDDVDESAFRAMLQRARALAPDAR